MASLLSHMVDKEITMVRREYSQCSSFRLQRLCSQLVYFLKEDFNHIPELALRVDRGAGYLEFIRPFDETLYDLLSVNKQRITYTIFTEVNLATLLTVLEKVFLKNNSVTAKNKPSAPSTSKGTGASKRMDDEKGMLTIDDPTTSSVNKGKSGSTNEQQESTGSRKAPVVVQRSTSDCSTGDSAEMDTGENVIQVEIEEGEPEINDGEEDQSGNRNAESNEQDPPSRASQSSQDAVENEDEAQSDREEVQNDEEMADTDKDGADTDKDGADMDKDGADIDKDDADTDEDDADMDKDGADSDKDGADSDKDGADSDKDGADSDKDDADIDQDGADSDKEDAQEAESGKREDPCDQESIDDEEIEAEDLDNTKHEEEQTAGGHSDISLHSGQEDLETTLWGTGLDPDGSSLLDSSLSFVKAEPLDPSHAEEENKSSPSKENTSEGSKPDVVVLDDEESEIELEMSSALDDSKASSTKSPVAKQPAASPVAKQPAASPVAKQPDSPPAPEIAVTATELTDLIHTPTNTAQSYSASLRQSKRRTKVMHVGRSALVRTSMNVSAKMAASDVEADQEKQEDATELGCETMISSPERELSSDDTFTPSLSVSTLKKVEKRSLSSSHADTQSSENVSGPPSLSDEYTPIHHSSARRSSRRTAGKSLVKSVAEIDEHTESVDPESDESLTVSRTSRSRRGKGSDAKTERRVKTPAKAQSKAADSTFVKVTFSKKKSSRDDATFVCADSDDSLVGSRSSATLKPAEFPEKSKSPLKSDSEADFAHRTGEVPVPRVTRRSKQFTSVRTKSKISSDESSDEDDAKLSKSGKKKAVQLQASKLEGLPDVSEV
ncbi:hypothetical protein EB796_018730 [Bugula neritina]|uniref:Uncharacterized protein n=1 Tax=Bugula neritina TaxID=10212 RepID=A0A7J7JBD9_BUGNE|nr:hypothetical protein EB796_018730 [Bugula neritina]